ncbi:MAG: YdcF family protein [Fimbriimonadaceae bacterium]|nr:YdcF family protein [Fimbriimonadaceae bacterium]
MAVVLGLLASANATLLGLALPWRLGRYTTLCYVLLALLGQLGPRWLRRLHWVGLAGLVTLSTVVATTPLAPTLLAQRVVDDGPAPADVIVVLSASTWSTSLNAASLERWLHGVELLHAGWAPAIVFTGDPLNRLNRFDALGPATMAAVGLPTAAVVPFEAPPRTPLTTWDEAQAIRAMGQARGWQRVLLVTSPSHTQRSKLAFEAQGLAVRVVPAASTKYDRVRPTRPAWRLAMFQDWVYETTALAVYRLRGRF